MNFCNQHQQNLSRPSRIFLSAPNISTGTEIVGVWKTKSYPEEFDIVDRFFNTMNWDQEIMFKIKKTI